MRGFISWKKQEKLIIFIRSPRNLSWSLACTRLISSILHVSTCLSTNADSCQFCSRAESLTTSVVLLFRTHDRLNSEVATCKGIRIPQYGKFWLVESRILGKFCSLIPESWVVESGIQLKVSTIPPLIRIQKNPLTKTGIQYLESGIHGV